MPQVIVDTTIPPHPHCKTPRRKRLRIDDTFLTPPIAPGRPVVGSSSRNGYSPQPDEEFHVKSIVRINSSALLRRVDSERVMAS